MAILPRKLSSDAEAGGLAILFNCTNCDEYSYTSPPPPPPPAAASAGTNHAIPYLVSAACAIGIALLLLTTCTILLRHRFSRSRSRRRIVSSTSLLSDEDHATPVDHPIWNIITVGLPQSVIDSIAALTYKTCDGAIKGSDCSVCLAKFEDGDALRLLPKCSHAFHLPCIDTWLRSHKNCPLCRAPVIDDSNPTFVEISPTQETAADDGDDVQASPVLAVVEGGDPVKRASSDVGQNVSAVNGAVQPVRRSMSLDSSAAASQYAVNRRNNINIGGVLLNEEGSSDQQKMVEVEEEEDDDREGHGDSALSRMMKKSFSSLSPFRASKSHSSSSNLPL